MRLERVDAGAIDQRADRTLSEAEAHLVGVRIGAVFVGVLGQVGDPLIARSLTQDWIYSQSFQDCEGDE